MSMGTQSSGGKSGGFPLDNLTYDLITLLYEKSKGLEAFDKYMKDAQGNQEIANLLRQMRQQDEQNIQQLHQHLHDYMHQHSQGGQASRAIGGSTGASGGGSSSNRS